MMISQISQPRLKGYLFPHSVISYVVWAYHRFALSLRDVEDLLAERGIVVSYETIRAWVEKFGAQIAKQARTVQAAKRFMSRLIARWGKPRVIVTDKLRSYGAALRKLGLDVDHRAHKGLNNRIEGSHRPTRKREKIQGRFKSACQAQKFLLVHDETAKLFCPAAIK